MLTQTLLEGLDITTFGTALPPLLVVRTRMSQAGTRATARADAIALELALPTDHTCQALGLGHARVIDHSIAGSGHGFVFLAGTARPFVAPGADFRRARHGEFSRCLISLAVEVEALGEGFAARNCRLWSDPSGRRKEDGLQNSPEFGVTEGWESRRGP